MSSTAPTPARRSRYGQHAVAAGQSPADSAAAVGKSKANNLGYFRYRKVGERYALTNEAGEWASLTQGEFEDLVGGRIRIGHARYQELMEKAFLVNPHGVRVLAERYRSRYPYLFQGPSLHAMVVTLRCNHSCLYCHASRTPMTAVETDMSVETAKKVVDFAFGTSSPWVNLEFQGGEPLVVFDPVVRFILDYAPQVARIRGKELTLSMVSNLSLMTEEILDELIEKKVSICTSLDGHKALHNDNRFWHEGDSYATTVKWMKRIHERYAAMGRDTKVYKVDPLLTVTKASLGHVKEIVDTYVELGCCTIHLRPVDPFGWGGKVKGQLGFEVHEFLDFYFEALEYIIELNKQGVEILESTAALYLIKMMGSVDPGYVDLRSPFGGGLGQIAYGYDGTLYTSDEGRMVAKTGDPSFELGRVGELTWPELMNHDVVKACAVASTLDGLPDCEQCAWKPYCGSSPEYNYIEQGNIFGQMRTSAWCAIRKAQFDWLFDRLATGGRPIEDIFKRWTVVKPREELVING